MEELLLLLQQLIDQVGPKWWKSRHISDSFRATLGMGEGVWEGLSEQDRLKHFVSRAVLYSDAGFLSAERPISVAEAYGLEGAPLTEQLQTTFYATIARKIASGNIDASNIMPEVQKAQAEHPEWFVSSTKRTVATNPVLELASQRALGGSWLSAIGNNGPLGRNVQKTLSGLTNDQVGNVLLALYSGGTASVKALLEGKGVGSDAILDLVTLAGATNLNQAIDTYYRLMDREQFADEILDRTVEEYRARLADKAAADHRTPPPTLTQAEMVQLRRYLSGKLWHVEENYKLYNSFNADQRAVLDQITGSSVWGTWTNVLSDSGDLDTFLRNERESLADYTLDDLRDEWTRIYQSLDPDNQDLNELGPIADVFNKMLDVMVVQGATERGEIGGQYLAEMKAAYAVNGDSIYFQLWDNRHPPRQQVDSLTNHALIVQALVGRDVARNPALDATQLAELEAEYSRRLQSIELYVSLNDIMKLDTDSYLLRQQMQRQGDGDLLEAIIYAKYEGLSTVDKFDFKRLYMAALKNLPSNLREDLAASFEEEWNRYMTANLGATNMSEVVDAATWIQEGVRALQGGEVKLNEHAFDAAVQEAAISQATTDRDRAIARTMGPNEQLLWELGIPFNEVGAAAQTVFAPLYDETADEYWERVEEYLRSQARLQKAKNPLAAIPLGLGQADSNFRTNYEAYAGGAIPDIVYAAELAGGTIRQSLERRKAATSRPLRADAATATAMRSPTMNDFLDEIAPFIGSLPITQQSIAQYNAILQEEALRAEFEKQLPTPEELSQMQTNESEYQNKMTEYLLRQTASSLGVSAEDAKSLYERGNYLNLVLTSQQLGLPLPPIPSSIQPAKDLGTDFTTSSRYEGQVQEEEELGGFTPPPAEEDEAAKARDALAQEFYKRMASFRETAPAYSGSRPYARTLTEYVTQQRGRLTSQQTTEGRLSPQLATRRIT